MAGGGDDGLLLANGLIISLDDIVLRVTTSGGPGGQHANRSLTAVVASFDVANATSLSSAQRVRLLERCGPVVRTQASRFRSQAQNREAALEQLAAKLSAGLHRDPPRRPSRPTKGSQQRRVNEKKARGETKRLRRSTED